MHYFILTLAVIILLLTVDEEFEMPSTLVQIVQDLDEGDDTSLGLCVLCCVRTFYS